MRKKGYIEAGVLQYVDDLMYTAEEIGHDIHFIEWLQNIRRWFRMQPKWRVKVAFATLYLWLHVVGIYTMFI